MIHSVAVIGQGLTGQLLSYALRHSGFSPLCFGQRVAPTSDKADPRTTALSAQSVAYLHSLGLWDAEALNATAIQQIEISDHDSPGLCHFHSHDVGPLGYIVANSALAQALCTALKDNAPTITDPVTNLTQEQAHVSLETAKQTHTARVVLAADGAGSPTRQALSLPCKVTDYQQTALVFTASHSRAHENTAFERFLPEGPLAFLPLPDQQSSVVWSLSHKTAQYLRTAPRADFTACLQQAFGDRLGKVSLVGERFHFPLTAHHTQPYGQGRVLLVGDAAHKIHPIAGQGFNLSIRDIQALLALLKARKQIGSDLGAEDLVAAYTKARRLDNSAMVWSTDRLNALFRTQAPLVQAGRRTGLALLEKLPAAKQLFTKHATGYSFLAQSGLPVSN